MRDKTTPETDAAERMAFAQEYMVPTAFARKLERERDEAREALEYIAHAGLSARHIKDYAKDFLRRKEAAK